MTLIEALEILGISEFAERIFKSNSHGELFHLEQYFMLAETIGTTDWFPIWFKDVVVLAVKEWARSESIFQHIGEILIEQYNIINTNIYLKQIEEAQDDK
jgi:hypothetical protein